MQRKRLSMRAGSGKEAINEVFGGFGVANVVEQLADLRLGELLDTPPPGFDEAVAIAKVGGRAGERSFPSFGRFGVHPKEGERGVWVGRGKGGRQEYMWRGKHWGR